MSWREDAARNVAHWTRNNAEYTAARALASWRESQIHWGIWHISEDQLNVIGNVANIPQSNEIEIPVDIDSVNLTMSITVPDGIHGGVAITVSVATPIFVSASPMTILPPKIPMEPVSVAGCATITSAGIEM